MTKKPDQNPYELRPKTKILLSVALVLLVLVAIAASAYIRYDLGGFLGFKL
jgi:hypothetical protein